MNSNQKTTEINKPHILILGIDQIRHKNLHQINAIKKDFDVLIYQNFDIKDSLDQDVLPKNCFKTLPYNYAVRLFFLIFKLFSLKKKLHHVEIYPGGRFSFIYTLLCRLFFIPTLIVERGDLILFPNASFFLKLSMRLTYKLGDAVWYREYYMKEKLERLTSKPLHFISNAVSIPSCNRQDDLPITFLWANRIIPERKADWIAKFVTEDMLSPATFTIVGLQGKDKQEETLKEAAHSFKNLNLISFTNPKPYFLKSRFFILPADIVFANFGLLEAMSYGIVPIVSAVNGTDQLVRNNINGITFDHNYNGFKDALIYAQSLSPNEYQRLSNAAKNTILEYFSIENYQINLTKMYKMIGSIPV